VRRPCFSRFRSEWQRHAPQVRSRYDTCSPLQIDGKYRILDMGPALGANVEFWSQFQCRLTLDDFYRDYRARMDSEPEASRERLIADLLPFDDQTVFDVILVWDLFNYLDPDELLMLVRQLSRWCRKGTVLFSLISSLPNIPARPTLFRILDREHMTCQVRARETRPCARHQPRDLARLLAGFEVSCSFLLRNGTQEYVFTYIETAQKNL
jgi:hypothetical protein